MDKLKLIKIVVALLTFLIVFGVLMAATLIFKKLNPPVSTEILSFSLDEPQGSVINSILEYNGYIYMLVKDGGEADRVLILNPETMQVNARVSLN